MHLEPIPPISPAHHHVALTHAADRLGAIASFLCALHCAALPFILALLPALGLGFLAGHLFEHIFIAFATLLATFTLIRSYRRHRMRLALLLLVPGLILLWTGGYVIEGHETLGWHALLVTLGGFCVALAHLTNLRLAHRHERAGCCEHGSANA